MDVVINTQGVRYGGEQGIRFLYRFIQGQFFDEMIGFGCIALSKHCPFISLDVTKAVGAFSLLPEIIPVLVC